RPPCPGSAASILPPVLRAGLWSSSSLAAIHPAVLTDPMGNPGGSAMDLDKLLLLIAFRHQCREADSNAGQARAEAIAGRQFDAAEFAAAVRRLTTAGLIHDPVFLP